MRRKIVVTLAILSILACAIYASRNNIARIGPGVPAYFSFDGEVFTYVNIFTEGDIGPFSVNAEKGHLLDRLGRYGKPFRVTMDMNERDTALLYYSKQQGVTSDVARVLTNSDEWKLVFREQGAVTSYKVTFSKGKAVSIRLLSTLVA